MRVIFKITFRPQNLLLLPSGGLRSYLDSETVEELIKTDIYCDIMLLYIFSFLWRLFPGVI